MEQRELGSSGLGVSALGLGCIGMSGLPGSADDAESVATIHRALDLGVTLLDIGDMDGAGGTEELVGRAIADRRDRVVLATKFASVRGPSDDARGHGGDPGHVRASCEASLRRLGVETIDLFYHHRGDPAIPIEETVGAMSELVTAGKVRHLGLADVSATTVRRAGDVHPIAAVQAEYSLWSREVETEILSTVRELGIGFVAHSPLGRGLLGGDPFVDSALAGVVGDLAREKNATPAQIALAWLLSRGRDVVPIPGTKRVPFVEENARAGDVVLEPVDLERLERGRAESTAAVER